MAVLQEHIDEFHACDFDCSHFECGLIARVRADAATIAELRLERDRAQGEAAHWRFVLSTAGARAEVEDAKHREYKATVKVAMAAQALEDSDKEIAELRRQVSRLRGVAFAAKIAERDAEIARLHSDHGDRVMALCETVKRLRAVAVKALPMNGKCSHGIAGRTCSDAVEELRVAVSALAPGDLGGEGE